MIRRRPFSSPKVRWIWVLPVSGKSVCMKTHLLAASSILAGYSSTLADGGVGGVGLSSTLSSASSSISSSILSKSSTSLEDETSSSTSTSSPTSSSSPLSSSTRTTSTSSSRSATSTRRSSSTRGHSSSDADTPTGASSLSSAAPPAASSSSAPVSPHEQVSSGSDHTGAIAGGVVGGVGGAILLAILAGLLFWAIRKKKRAQPANYVHDVSQEPGPSFGPSNDVPPGTPPQRAAAVPETSTTISHTAATTSAPAPAVGAITPPSTALTSAGTGAGAGLAAGGLASVSSYQTPSPSAAAQTTTATSQPTTQMTDNAVGMQATSTMPYTRPSRATRSPPTIQRRVNNSQVVTPYAEYADVDPALWRDTWASADSPYGLAGVGHAPMEDEASPPRAFHMQPGQLVSNFSPVGAFSQPWNAGNQGQAVPTRSSRVIRESLGQGEAVANERT